MKFESAMRAMRRGETVRRKGGKTAKLRIVDNCLEKFGARGWEKSDLPTENAAIGSTELFATDWVIVRKKKRPDKPAPKVYTESELEPVGTPVVKGDKIFLPSRYIEQEYSSNRPTTVRDVGSYWISFDGQYAEGVDRCPAESFAKHWRILKRSLRDVFKDPRVGDVVVLGRASNTPHKILYVDGNYVFAESLPSASYWRLTDWAMLATSNHTVISRAESK